MIPSPARRVLRLLPALGLVLAAFPVLAPPAEGCGVNLGDCRQGCNATVNAGTCSRGCDASVNAGRCGKGSELAGLARGPAQCADGVDNDADGVIDLADANCFDEFDRYESFDNPCPDERTHWYEMGLTLNSDSGTVRSTTLDDGAGSVGVMVVTDLNVEDCDGDGIPWDYDGDYETGAGGAFFGYGTHSITDVCGYNLNTHGGHVEVYDIVFGHSITFLTAENDQSGPIFVPITDPTTNEQIGTFCDTPGGITPSVDPDDCISDADSDPGNGYTSYVGSGDTCGTGGGDGGFWVFLNGVDVEEWGGSPGLSNGPTEGSITVS